MTRIFLPSWPGGPYILPRDFNPAANLIECYGAGANGARYGGGGGAYAASLNCPLRPGQTVYLTIGLAGPAGGNTWLNGAADAAPSASSTGVLAAGAGPAYWYNSGSYGQGGQASACIGTTVYSGGNGGDGAGGGGGCAGPNGAGANGGQGQGANGGGGGGGANNGSAGSAFSPGPPTGGNGRLGSGGGIAYGGSAIPGFGGGGAGGYNCGGGTGAVDSIYPENPLIGPGGGGGGSDGAAAGSQAALGGGGGGYYGIAYNIHSGGAFGPGGNGFIVITYTPLYLASSLAFI